jgi:hypothetical protein
MMRDRRPILGLLVGALLLGAGFGAGWFARDAETHGAPVFVGSGRTGAETATFFVGDDAYGFRSSVSWTDAGGSFHDGGWPDCLPHSEDVSAVRFAGMTVWAGGVGTDEVVWVDCRS